ncbi:hypothetical protein CSUI_004951 [Cystoisospora suis]|uniref:Uncharacterized protein n=1 Tax=Cystoisospora suis TaxID=483139 RepID=A0A2C6KL39_9APIC|nr:hypothetical protein CSUI_004951 [Cystoisospora suis]
MLMRKKEGSISRHLLRHWRRKKRRRRNEDDRKRNEKEKARCHSLGAQKTTSSHCEGPGVYIHPK